MSQQQIPVLFSEQEIAQRIATLSIEIAKDLPREFLIVSLLRGSFMFTSDLIRAMHRIGLAPQIDFMTLASYHAGTSSTGQVTIQRDITEDVSNKMVLIVDDILETGRTLHYAQNLLRERGARDLRIAVLLEKPGKRLSDVKADFVGFTVPDKFVVGYGLDYANHYRELPYIGALDIH